MADFYDLNSRRNFRSQMDGALRSADAVGRYQDWQEIRLV